MKNTCFIYNRIQERSLYIILILYFVLFFISCEGYYNNLSSPIDRNRKTAALLLRKPVNNDITDLILWANNLKIVSEEQKIEESLIDYLGVLSLKEEEPFKSYLNFLVSQIYWEKENIESSLLYLSKIDRSAYNLQYDYMPIGLISSQRVIKSNISPYSHIEAAFLTISVDFADFIDVPLFKKEFAEFYRSNYRIDKAVVLMEEIIAMSNKNQAIKNIIDLRAMKNDIWFYRSSKDWIYKDLEELVSKIQKAVQARNELLLSRYVSKTSFEGRLWSKEKTMVYSYRDIYISNKWNRNIVFSTKLEDFSSETEAYLKTTNWNFSYLQTWYLYFKKVDYPYDNRINGGWEWKGIYFGERS